MFSLKIGCGFWLFGCEFIFTQYILHLQWKLFCYCGTAPYQPVTGIQSSHCPVSPHTPPTIELLPEIYQQFWRRRIYHVLPQLLKSLWGRRGWSRISKKGQTVLENDTGNAIQSFSERVSMWAEFRDGVRQRDKVPYSWAWGADGLLSMSSLFSFSGLSSIQPLHSHSGWVLQQGFNDHVYVWVCCMQGWGYLRHGLINLWSSRQWAHSCTDPRLKVLLWPAQMWSCD